METLVEEGIYLSGPENGSVWLELFLIDVYPTTNGDYAKFVAATRHRPPEHWPGGRCAVALATHPVVWVTWHDATRADRRQVPHYAKFLAERRWDEREDTADGR
ncbi:SUMF1/EgtB/PvdO family nonheme iron enzyme [Streptomyces lydicus]|uniref:SUMF1/EgtB/PvdO family nonheme iron enzyme n=1 Tax=Streptomyces lydicus TaxID=47763 RepID=UPI0034243CC3